MEQKKHHEQSQEQLPFSEQLRQSIMNQPYDPADLWGRAADSFPQNKRNYRRIGDALFILSLALDSIIICNFTKITTAMSTAGLINRYVWFVTTIYNRGRFEFTS